ncbi:MAG: TlpA family protein disulfide reductase [Candidatus Liptonbacteria bacterium]|nr:TlpA family protein disulfide reductase [Candidatus Liptonbacteria bacterium]
MSTKAIVGGIALLAVALLVAGGLNSTSVPASPSLQSASLQSVVRNGNVPDFSLEKLDGGTITLSEFSGKKPVVVDFWASWCPNCRRDMPRLNGFYEKYKDKVAVVGVNLQESASTVRDFIASRGISFPIALDPYGQASNAFGVRSTNTHVLIHKDGTVARTIPGDIQESDILSLIE